jgi:hypothetical protein
MVPVFVRLPARRGVPKSVVAMAQHLARLVYRFIASCAMGDKSVERGIQRYEKAFWQQRIKWLKKEASFPNSPTRCNFRSFCHPFPERDAWSPPWLSREPLQGEATGPLKEPVMVG